MKNKLLVFLSCLIFSFTNAQIEKKLDDFDKVTAFDKIDVLLIKSDENKILLNGADANQVELVIKNGELKIRMPFTKLLSGDHISATVYFKDIKAVEANEGSRIASEAVFKTLFFEVIAKEGGHVKINVDTQKIVAKVANGAEVNISGNAINQDVVVNSGGVYQGKNLVTNQSTITVNAGGSADIYSKELVDAKVRAGGTILIAGKPKQINQKIFAGGTIKEVN
ncbi:head GIN domain-containing protein [Flavobacterium aciduliphilum]|uniref:Putative autotransporter adhesin-like protein n=1 Tax=Flavobacterium aciduliphilum TaxID=1101402 RepID=A0A328YHW3_9FLAO|nr:head GIN domain-containing protein [Flavobacterium aciduliphilum]RAR72884.1 putative autotransporter adhesin-like protein [Flavobacterium aciduliphilum]